MNREELESSGWKLTLDREDRRIYEKPPWKITEAILKGANPPYSYFAMYGPETWGLRIKSLLDIIGRLQWAKENTHHQHCKLCKTPFKSIGKFPEIFCTKCFGTSEAQRQCPHPSKNQSWGEYTGAYCHSCGENRGC